jgi:sortase (surface protein transpeptidase)
VEVPPLGADSRAGWYRYSPSPGQLGPAVILGHVDSTEYGPGVFFRLGDLRPGDTLTVARTDRIAATFRVDRVVSYPKNQFPTLEVYGNTSDAELRLITCGGAYDSSARSYLDNIVVYASLVSSSAA